jgi:hypothetical protein
MAAEAEYRRQLGVENGEELPSMIGQAHSAGAAKGGKPGARPPHRNRFGGDGPTRALVTPDIKLTAEQVRTVKCPRCLAAVDAPCRNQYGRAVSAGHADRRRLAQRRIAEQRKRNRSDAAARRVPRDRRSTGTITGEELAERQATAERTRAARQPRTENSRTVYSVEAATSRVQRHRLRVDNGT